ncbi:MAG: hypothetical protein P8X91_10580 [Candidatus Bathyarchaeota archaeon]
MKLNRLVFVIICLSIISAFLIGPTIALEENEATATAFWLTEPINQGSIETVTIFFVNNSPQELQIYLVGLHFDWMETDQFVGNNLSNDPVVIPSYESYNFNSIAVDIPENYRSSEAQSLLGQAQNAYSQAISSADSSNWDYAISLLQSASNYIEQAEVKEEEFIETSGSIDPLVILIGIGVIVIVVLVIIIFVRQKRMKTVSKEQKSNELENFDI